MQHERRQLWVILFSFFLSENKDIPYFSIETSFHCCWLLSSFYSHFVAQQFGSMRKGTIPLNLVANCISNENIYQST